MEEGAGTSASKEPNLISDGQEPFFSFMDLTPQELADSGFCSIQLSRSAPDKKPLLRIHEGMECLNSASVAAVVARVATLGCCSLRGGWSFCWCF